MGSFRFTELHSGQAPAISVGSSGSLNSTESNVLGPAASPFPGKVWMSLPAEMTGHTAWKKYLHHSKNLDLHWSPRPAPSLVFTWCLENCLEVYRS